MTEGAIEPSRSSSQSEKSWLARIWGGFDTKYMKPLLTHSKPTLMETLPPCCLPVARMLTTSEQLNQASHFKDLFLGIWKIFSYYRDAELMAIQILNYVLTMPIAYVQADQGPSLPPSQDSNE